jgi:dTDP-4-dehydrorhamnose 3,5-epimerase
MRFVPTRLPGVIAIKATPHRDERGSFARVYCPEEFRNAGITFSPVQINISSNVKRQTLRGLHWQDAPFAEAKIVRAVRGSAFDVVVDLRRDSPTFREWVGFTLDADDGNAVLIPEGCAHGFLTLADSTDILYQMGAAYEPGHARGARWDDPAFGMRIEAGRHSRPCHSVPKSQVAARTSLSVTGRLALRAFQPSPLKVRPGAMGI